MQDSSPSITLSLLEICGSSIDGPVYELNSQSLREPVEPPHISERLLAGRYEIKSLIAKGGMSFVFLGFDRVNQKVCAIKTVKLSSKSNEIARARFFNEMKSLTRLNHPNVVHVHDCVTNEQGHPFIIMDYLNGPTLLDLLLQEKRLPLKRIRSIFNQVCAGLEHAHINGVVHRDLKPGNIILMPDRHKELVKIVDFGLARIVEEDQRLTSPGRVAGTLPYMSPEQCRAEGDSVVDLRSDIYTLGAVLYEALTGRDPFYGHCVVQTLRKHQFENPPPFSELSPPLEVPRAVELVVMKALEKTPEKRFQSMKEFAYALNEALDGNHGSKVESEFASAIQAIFAKVSQSLTDFLK